MKVFLLFMSLDPFIKLPLFLLVLLVLGWLSRRAFRSAPGITDSESGEPIYDSEPLDEHKFICEIPSDFPGQPATSPERYLFNVFYEEEPEKLQEFLETQYPVKLGYYCKHGWTACLPFYLFRCLHCGQWAVGHKHGLQPKLKCFHCEKLNYFYEFS